MDPSGCGTVSIINHMHHCIISICTASYRVLGARSADSPPPLRAVRVTLSLLPLPPRLQLFRGQVRVQLQSGMHPSPSLLRDIVRSLDSPILCPWRLGIRRASAAAEAETTGVEETTFFTPPASMAAAVAVAVAVAASVAAVAVASVAMAAAVAAARRSGRTGGGRVVGRARAGSPVAEG